MNIITLTLNPAFDVHCSAEGLTLYHENLALVRSTDAGGKGVNLSRALTANQIPNTPVVVLGEENGDRFRKCLEEEGLGFLELTVPGRIRENMTFYEENKPETRISFHGFFVTDELIDRLEQLIFPLVGKETLLTLTGRLAEGLSMERVQRFLSELRKIGVRTIIDSRSFDKENLFLAKPWLIKPNEEEIFSYTGQSVKTLSEAAEAAHRLYERGIENVMISLGAQGAVLCCDEGVYLASAPQITVRSTVGAGDSAIAGFLAAFSKNATPDMCLQAAVAFGCAACLQEGTAAPRPENVHRLWKEINVETIL